RHLGEHFPDIRERSCIRGRIGARCPSYRRLVYLNHLVNVLYALHALVRSRTLPRLVDYLLWLAGKYLMHQRGFAGAGYARHADELAQRELNRYVSQVVLSSTPHDYALPVALAALLGQCYHPLASQVLGRYRVGLL